jgi:hypothetical protein
MIPRPFQSRTMRSLAALVIFCSLTNVLPAAPTGPTLNFNYGMTGQPLANPLNKFMYFVPLISPELVSVFTNTGNSQCARVLSFVCQTNAATFHVTCEFDFIGAGLLRNDFDHALTIQRHDGELKAGKRLPHQIASISVQGTGTGIVEIDGTLTNGVRAVTGLRMRFNSHGHTSPVNILLEDIYYRAGVMQVENETVARVNSLKFFKKAGEPKMEVTLASVKRKDASDSLWQNLIGGLKGAAANLLLPPLAVTTDGYHAMMDFGMALATQKTTFTFPFATRLQASPTKLAGKSN